MTFTSHGLHQLGRADLPPLCVLHFCPPPLAAANPHLYITMPLATQGSNNYSYIHKSINKKMGGSKCLVHSCCGGGAAVSHTHTSKQQPSSSPLLLSSSSCLLAGRTLCISEPDKNQDITPVRPYIASRICLPLCPNCLFVCLCVHVC